MEKIYIAPAFEVIEIKVEYGFASSEVNRNQVNDIGNGGGAF